MPFPAHSVSQDGHASLDWPSHSHTILSGHRGLLLTKARVDETLHQTKIHHHILFAQAKHAINRVIENIFKDVDLITQTAPLIPCSFLLQHGSF
jgi:hypothetical protein